MPDDTDVLRELLRQAERVLDHQARGMEEQDDKTEQPLALGVATLGGGLALATWVTQVGGSDLFFGLLIAAGALVNLVSLPTLMGAYLVLPLTLQVGPHPRWLAEQARDLETVLREVLLDLVETGPAYYEMNANALIRTSRERGRGLRLLLVAVCLYVLSAAYMLVQG